MDGGGEHEKEVTIARDIKTIFGDALLSVSQTRQTDKNATMWMVDNITQTGQTNDGRYDDCGEESSEMN